MRRSTLYVGILSLLNATNLWCHCEDDEVTLLQLNKRVNTSHVPSVNAPHVHSVETLLQAALRAKALAASGENPEAVNLAIEAVQEALEQMKPNIQGEHDQVQTQIQRQFEEIQACHSSEGHGASVVTGLQDDMADIAACLHDVDTAVSTHTTACGLWETHVAETALPSCASGSDSQQFFSAAQSLHTWVHDQWHILEPLHENCQQAIITLNDERVRCDPLIAEYNTVFCQHFLSCRLLSACHNHELAIYNQMKIDTLPGQTFRQNQWRTVEQAQCILAHTSTAVDTSETADDASLTSCDDDISVEHLVLSFTDPTPWVCASAPQAGDPQCPDVHLPDGWTDGGGTWDAPPIDCVVFDSTVDPALSVSPCTVTGEIRNSWGHVANTNRQVSAGDGICGVSFKCVTAETHAMVGITPADLCPITWYRNLYFGIGCRGLTTTSSPDIYEGNGVQVAGTYTFPSRFGNGNPTTDVHAISRNADGLVQYSLNGEVYKTSDREMTFPWHVAVDGFTGPGLAEVQYLQC